MDNIKKIELNMLKELKRIAYKYNISYYLGYGSLLGAVREHGFIPWDTDIDVIVLYEDYEVLCEKLFKELDEKYVLKSYHYDKNYDSLKARIALKDIDHHLVHIDIFPLIGISSDYKLKKRQVRLSYIIYKSYYAKKLKSFQLYKKDKIKLFISLLVKVPLFFIPSTLIISIFEKMCRKYSTKETKYLHNPCGSYGMKEVIPKSYLGKGKNIQFENITVPIPELYNDYLCYVYGEDYMIPKKNNYI